MTEEKETLQEETNDASITASATGNTDDGAAVDTAEDTHTANPENEIIKQQQSTIDALMQRTEELTKQINRLISSGAQITDDVPEQTQDINNILPEDYVPLKDLGAEIGKHDRYKPTA